MSTSLFYKIKSNINEDKHRIIELFFMDFIDNICGNKTFYKVERDVYQHWEANMVHYQETFRIDFERNEDKLAICLRGIPAEFQLYLELVDQ